MFVTPIHSNSWTNEIPYELTHKLIFILEILTGRSKYKNRNSIKYKHHTKMW